MRLLHHRGRGRAGFTLIELLVVIAIIAILASLLGAGIYFAYTRATDTGAQIEINQLEEAIKAFKAKYGIPPPDHFRLYSNQADYAADTSALSRSSLNVIYKMWPNIGNFGSVATTNPPLAWVDGVNPFVTSNTLSAFTGASNPYKGVQFIDLEGDQCIVFFLQGIPLNASAPFTSTLPGFGGQGFSANPKNPTQAPSPPGTPGVGRVGPFYNFTATRYMPRPNGGKVNGGANDIVPSSCGVTSPLPNQPPGTFLSYMDYYSSAPSSWTAANPPTVGQRGYTPYVYYSANGAKNGYVPYFITFPATDQYNGGRFITAYFQPYVNKNTNSQLFQNPNSWQLTSAGPDGYFNSLAAIPTTSAAQLKSPFQWNSNAVTYLYQTTVSNRPVGGQDDIVNFYGNKLGVSQ